MYRVYTRGKGICAILCILLALFMLFGIVGRVAIVSATPRELPIYSVETEEKLLSLGINCAWDDSDIDEMLALLKEKNITATFFIVGDWCDRYPKAVKKIADAGHELGSHSDRHPDMTKLDRERIVQELDASKRKIETVSGQKIHLFRAPSGAYNNLVVSTARSLGWEVIQWSNDNCATDSKPLPERVC